jgi:hypothetical protein
VETSVRAVLLRPVGSLVAAIWEYSSVHLGLFWRPNGNGFFLFTPTKEEMAAGSTHCVQLQRTEASFGLPERFGFCSHFAAAEVQSIASLGPGVSVGVFVRDYVKRSRYNNDIKAISNSLLRYQILICV